MKVENCRKLIRSNNKIVNNNLLKIMLYSCMHVVSWGTISFVKRIVTFIRVPSDFRTDVT